MPIPDFQTIMLPHLQSCADGQEHGLRETIETLATTFQLTEEERQQLLPSGSQAIFDNRVGWSKTHLMKAGLLESPRRAYFKLTEAGREVLKANPKELNVAYLKRYPAYLEFIGPNVGKSGKQEEKEVVLESAYGKIRKALASRYGKGKEAAAVSCSFFINLIKHERHAKMDKFCPDFVDCFLPGFGIPR